MRLEATRLEAIAIRLEAIASGLEAIAIRLEAIAIRLEAIAIRLEAIAIRLEAIAIRLELEAIAIRLELEAIAIRLEAMSTVMTCAPCLHFAQPAQHPEESIPQRSHNRMMAIWNVCSLTATSWTFQESMTSIVNCLYHLGLVYMNPSCRAHVV